MKTELLQSTIVLLASFLIAMLIALLTEQPLGLLIGYICGALITNTTHIVFNGEKNEKK